MNFRDQQFNAELVIHSSMIATYPHMANLTWCWLVDVHLVESKSPSWGAAQESISTPRHPRKVKIPPLSEFSSIIILSTGLPRSG